jgi:hypothetical protein
MQPLAAAAAALEGKELEQVQQQVAEWLRLDRDAASRAAVQQMLDNKSHAELKELMCQRLEFGKWHREACQVGFSWLGPEHKHRSQNLLCTSRCF